MYFQEPGWLQTLKKTTKKQNIKILKSRHLKKSFKNRSLLDLYIKKELSWIYSIDWRSEQKLAIQSFHEDKNNELVIQAVFGSGKTTIMLAIIQNLLFNDYTEPENLFIMAFNVAIKNEIKKKLHNHRLVIKTYDSLIYTLCKELGMGDELKFPNFDGKRRFVRENIEKVQKDENVKFVFVDETQDLEKNAYRILKQRFCNARFLFIGDIFQSIQKEPRESVLWYLLQNGSPNRKIITMKTTPRVPENILDEIKIALLQFYPEFQNTISQWSSSNMVSQAHVFWHPFTSYKDVYTDLLEFCKKYAHEDIMILTFSSAITVRGSLGDVARVRKFLNTSGIQTNANHKNMIGDRVFLSTANSSKGLERKHVFCFLTFPLEKAFSNFSDDLVVNIMTVALSRAKDTIDVYIPRHKDRFSKVLHLYKQCPKPTEDKQYKKQPAPLIGHNPFLQDIYDMKTMLEQEHGVTELLRQGILSFETKQELKTFVKKFQTTEIVPIRTEEFRNEEGCAFLGILFETLILSNWTNRWPTSACTENLVTQHEMYSNFIPKIADYRKRYLDFIKKHAFQDRYIIFKGCVLFAKLHLACYQKLFVNITKEQEVSLFQNWCNLYPKVQEIKPKCNLEKLKTQSNVGMTYVTGIADALVTNDVLEVIEIKASRSPEWCEHALIQAILYGMMLGKSYFKIHLINVSKKEVASYAVSFKGRLLEMRDLVQQEVAIWNLNCFLSKNVTHNDDSKKGKLKSEGLYFLDGRPKEDRFTLIELTSPTKTFIIANNIKREKIFEEIQKRNISNLYISRFLENQGFRGMQLIFPTNHFNLSQVRLWKQFLSQIGYDHIESKINWLEPLATLSVQLCRLAQIYNF